MRCSSRAEGAVLDGSRSVAGVWGGVYRARNNSWS